MENVDLRSTDVFLVFFLSGSSQGQKRRGVEAFLLLVCEWVGGFLVEDQGSKSTQVSAFIFPCNVLLDLWGSSQSLRKLPISSSKPEIYVFRETESTFLVPFYCFFDL